MESRLSVRSLTIAAAGALLMFAAAAPHTQGGGSATSQPPQGSPPVPQAPARGNRGGGAPGGGTIVRGPNGEMWGYSDSAFNAGSRWRVHDPDRPQPPVVTPAGPVIIPPPSDAIVLFDGKDLSKWVHARTGQDRRRRVGGSRRLFRDGPGRVDLYARGVRRRAAAHRIRDADPGARHEPESRQQRRQLHGPLRNPDPRLVRQPNLRRRQAGAIYGETPPLVNASRKPGEWQSYDIVFEAPRFTGRPARRPTSPSCANGIVVQNRKEHRHDDGNHDARHI